MVILSQGAHAQVVISDEGATDPDPSAILDLQSTSKGFLAPRMTAAQIDAISEPAEGLMIYQIDGEKGYYYNTGTIIVPVWDRIIDETSPIGYWTQTGNDINYSTGNVGIGNSTPATKLDVDGPAWFNDSIYVDGRPGALYLNGQTNFEPSVKLTYEDDPKFTLRYRIPDGTYGDDYLMIDTDEQDEVWGISDFGRVNHDYYGTEGSGYYLTSSTPHPAMVVENQSTGFYGIGVEVAMSSTSASPNSVGIFSHNYGDGFAIYGKNEADSNYGFIGQTNFGVYGQHGATSNRGNFGTSSAGAMGLEGTRNNIGLLGTDDAGVIGEFGGLYYLNEGDYAVKGFGSVYDNENGTDYAYDSNMGGVLGYDAGGSTYSFGVAGFTADANQIRSAAILGSNESGSLWGALAYRRASGSRVAGYFTTGIAQNGGDNATTAPIVNIGISSYGDLMGAHINGNVYGLYAKGKNYGIYANGDVYRTGVDVHLQANDKGENTVMYTQVSTEMTVQTYGIGTMQNGKSNIVFDKAFADVVSQSEPIVITVTPIGKSEGVYLEEVDGMGFSVSENRDGKSSVQFSWIAIGKRKGFENMELPEAVIAADYTEKISRGLHNDVDKTTAGEGLYYQNGQLLNGQLSEPPADDASAQTGNGSLKNKANAARFETMEHNIQSTTSTKDKSPEK